MTSQLEAFNTWLRTHAAVERGIVVAFAIAQWLFFFNLFASAHWSIAGLAKSHYPGCFPQSPLAIITYWFALKRFQWLAAPLARLLFIGIAFLSHPLFIAYKEANTSGLVILIPALALVILSMRAKVAKYLLLGLLGSHFNHRNFPLPQCRGCGLPCGSGRWNAPRSSGTSLRPGHPFHVDYSPAGAFAKKPLRMGQKCGKSSVLQVY